MLFWQAFRYASGCVHDKSWRVPNVSVPTAIHRSNQVWSLSSFKVSCQLLTNDLNQVSSVSLLMTSSTALANEGLFELTRRPSLTRAVSSSFAETTEEPGCSQVKFAKICQNQTKFGLFTWQQPVSSVVSANDDETACVNEGRRVSSKSPSLASLSTKSWVRKWRRIDSSFP